MKQFFILLSVLFVSVSLCPDTEFQCTSGQCLPAAVVCNFQQDCDDGSDEELCGSCDFEHHSCGWKDTNQSSFHWKLQMANVTLVPGEDHTTSTPWGHVMHVDGKQGGGFSSKAILEYSVNSTAALGCQISFWYHIHDEDPHASSSDFRVKMRRGTAEEELLKISESKTNSWENATAFIGNQPQGYQLLFFFTLPFLEKKDIMLDDISFDNCEEADIPVGSDQLSCDFEQDTCSWYHDYTANLMWKRTKGTYGDEGPGHDHTNGKGYYMFTAAKNNLNPSSAARLMSYPQPAGQVICVSFWYHMFGSSIGALKFMTKHASEQETVVWMRTGTQGNMWRFADLTFNSDTPIQFTIEAVPGTGHGSISIDDIVMTSSEHGSCPAERECTFQGSLCGLQPQPTADFSWSRITGTSQPANSSGPAADHTLGTDQGYYLSAQLWSHPVGSRGKMATAVMEPTPPDGECLMFWYYMEGTRVGELNLYLKTPSSHESAVQLWKRSGDQGKHWRHGRATLLSPNTPYQVIFEAVVGEGPKRDIAIDDLTVLNSACPLTGFCDFEMDFCGWVNNPPVKSEVDWDWLSGTSDGKFIPDRDHSTNSPLGHFAAFLSSESNTEEIAQLESESMEAVNRACLEFWHYALGWSVNRPSNIVLTVLINETSGLRSVWNTSGYMNSTWFQARVDYNASGLHQIIFQATNPDSKEGSFALDDVHIMRGVACDDIVLTTTLNPATTTTTAPVSSMDCTFEQGLCNWYQENSDDSDWSLSHGLQADQPWDGPQYDHTVGNNQGFYLRLNGSGSKDGDRAVISVPVINLASQFCVGFWFYMSGPLVSNLGLLVQTKTSELLAWTRSGSQNPEWINTQVTISRSDAKQVMLAGHRNTDSRGFIAIDDITVREGACSDQNSCGFDSSWCGFENDVSLQGRWHRKKGTKDNVDHTYGTENGFYMTVMTSNSTQPEVAQLLTPELSANEMCIRFWYWLPAGSSSELEVHVLRSGIPGDALWQRSGAPSMGWEVAEVTVSSPEHFHVVFKALSAQGNNSTVQIDDFSARDGACFPRSNCDFESGPCTWVNIPRKDGHDWFLANGGFQGPPTDHTIQTPEGWFLLSLSQSANPTHVAQVVSEWIQLKDTPSCLTLWYHMDNRESGTFRVYMRSGPSEQDLLFNTSSSGSSWTRFSQSLVWTKPKQLLIEAETVDSGFIAVDDITLTSGLCQVNETSGGFVGCTFENGTCGWEDVSDGPFQWLKSRNATDNVGPPVDHTLGTELGWYVAVQTDRGDHIHPATLQSPPMKQASTMCTLHFYYYMYGEGELKVLLKNNFRATTLYWLSGNQGEMWRHAEVTVDRILHDFTIVFEASRNFNNLGHIAIDDIEFANCTLPEPQPSCSENMFMCDNRVCVDHNQLCDYSDDCGDRSDENNCEQQGVLERCNFEQGLCSWAESDVDTAGTEWTRFRGQEAWPKQGPPRDHTQNSAAGHFVVPGTHLNEGGQTSEILSKTLQPSSNCTVRFFFYMDDAAASLRVQSRSLRSGSDDTVLWHRENSQSFSWQRAEVTFSSSANSKIVFCYERGFSHRGLVALDDISFSKECVFDPGNSELPDTSSTSAPHTSPATPSTSTVPTNPCQDNEFFCWRSFGEVCILKSLQCDYQSDCPKGEDEDGCGPCTFERDQCHWINSSGGQNRWHRQKASNKTKPPTDHTTATGYYMRVNFSQGEARLQSPSLPPSSPYCQIQFHFHISTVSAGSLRVLMQQAEGREAILWSRSHNTVSQWIQENLPLGLHQQPYKVWFSWDAADQGGQTDTDHNVAVDDISFINCEKSFQPPALSAFGCSFEDGLCGWMQGGEDDLDWLIRSGPTETLNTGPAGDRTLSSGEYLYIETSPPSVKGNVAQLKSLLLPPAGEGGYCFRFWYHMFGATVGSLRVILQTADLLTKTVVWQKSGNQGDEWQLVQSHVTVQKVHQVILEATVGGEAGDIAVDDVSLINGPCPTTDLCDFEEGNCDWEQHTTDDADWVRHSGSTPNPNTGPDCDHTTNTSSGHYYYLPSSFADRHGQRAQMLSPFYKSGTCVQLWYHMYGKGTGILNVYQQDEQGKQSLLFSQTGDQGLLWRFAQAPLLPGVQPYKIVVEGVKVGPSEEGDMAFDDVQVVDARCSPPGYCDFESSMCSWCNLRGGVDQGDWLRGRGASLNPNTGSDADHTTNSKNGYYLYVDSSVGQWGDLTFLISDVLQPDSSGHCLKFWYRMYGHEVGILRVYINDRKMQSVGNDKGILHWIKTGNNDSIWHEASVRVDHKEAFWFVYVYQRGQNSGGDVALDDISIVTGPCHTSIDPYAENSLLTILLSVGLTLLAGSIVCAVLVILHRKKAATMKNDATDQNSMVDLYDCRTADREDGTEIDHSFSNTLYEGQSTDAAVGSSES